MGWQVAALRPADPASSLRVFRSNQLFGWIILVGLVSDSLLLASSAL
jgi:hypothetical protein